MVGHALGEHLPAGYTPIEVHEELGRRRKKTPTIKTVRKHYNMDCMPEGNHARMRKHMVFDCEPFASAIVEIVELNPSCYMSSAYDVLVEKFMDSKMACGLSFSGSRETEMICSLWTPTQTGLGSARPSILPRRSS